jgi:hypothetical protein
MREFYTLADKEKEYYLLSSTHFNLFFNVTKQHRGVFSKLDSLINHTTGCNKELWCIVTNAARALSYGAMTMRIPRDRKAYIGNVQKISSTRMKIVLDTLELLGYFDAVLGGFDGDKNIVSMYRMTEKFTMLWENVDKIKCEEYHPSVVVKDRDTGIQRDLSHVKGSLPIRKQVEEYNNILSRVELQKDGVRLPRQFYFRSFLDNLEKGGRYYNSCGGIQTLPQKERNKLTINNERVVELDFKAMHPSILYDWEWQKDPEFVEQWVNEFFGGVYDPYRVDVSDFINVDQGLVENYRVKHNLTKYDPVRNLIKYAVMVGINADSHQGACAAVTKKLYSESNTCVDDPDLSFYGIIVPPKVKGLVSFRSSYFCNACKLTNGPIEKYFFTDKGVDLQFVDSEIMTQVLNTLTMEGEAAFSEHDSIIVRESVAERAEYLMRVAYESIIGSARFCLIEKK